MNFLIEKLAYSNIDESETFIDVKVIALSATCVKRTYGELCFTEDVLKECAAGLAGKPVLVDHSDSIDSIVGVVLDSFYDDEKKAIVATLRISKKGNEKFVELLKLSPSPITDVSIGAYIETEQKDGKYYAKGLKFIEISFVLNGADPNAKRLRAEKPKEKWWEDPELINNAPPDFFLDPLHRRYPYRTFDGNVSRERLEVVMALSVLHGHRQIYERAKAVYQKHFGGMINGKINKRNTIYDE